VAWLSKRLARRCARQAEAIGFQPGRRAAASGDNGPVAHFHVPDRKGRRITAVRGPRVRRDRETAFRYSAEGNVKVVLLDRSKLAYTLSADVGKDDLLKVATWSTSNSIPSLILGARVPCGSAGNGFAH